MARIFEPIRIGKMEVKNRIVAAPTVVCYADEDGYVTQRLIDLYEERAKGGAGLVVVEASFIRQDGRMFARQVGVHTHYHTIGLSELADAIHQAGAKAALQVMHGGRQANSRFSGCQPIAPSDKAYSPWMGDKPRVMTTEECTQLADDFATACLRVKEAGFDAVMFHATHGFVIQQFMSPYTNDRKDKYGDRMAFPTEVIQKTRAAVGPDFPIIFRISGDEFLGDQGITLEMNQKEIVPALLKAGVDCLDISVATLESFHWIIQPIYFPRGCIVHLAEGIKEVSNVPVVAVGRINDPRLAEKIVEDGRADMVALCRALLADPAFPRKMQEGREREIRKCIACNYCTDRTFGQRTVKCAVNPDFGNERAYRIQPALKPKKVLVVGGGVGGMEAARVAALRGHQVTLWEREKHLGGLTNRAAALPRLYVKELANVIEWLPDQLKRLLVQVETGKEATAQAVEAFQADAVVLATGSRPVPLDLPIAPGPQVITLDEYLAGGVQVGQRVTVIGGAHGSEVAVSLGREGKTVTLLESGPPELIASAPYMDMVRRVVLQGYLQEAKVNVLTQVKVKGITSEGVELTHADGRQEMVAADTVIAALERRADNQLAQQLRGKVAELYQVGDGVEPRRMAAAIHEAAFWAREI